MIQSLAVLCKFRVVCLMLLCAWVGMLLTPITSHFSLTMLFGLLGIGLLSSAGGAMNQLAEQALDAKMRRTAHRPLVKTTLTTGQVWCFIAISFTLGTTLLLVFTNILATLLTVVTMLGYGVFYTLLLKPNTHQNIVIGGLFGAMPPLLGWCALYPHIEAAPLLLVLLIFCWTPAHFWSLAIAKQNDYLNTDLPMMPITHGIKTTRLAIVLYAILTITVSQLPFAIGILGYGYWIGANLLNIIMLLKLRELYYKESAYMKFFVFSNLYLMLLFSIMLIDNSTWYANIVSYFSA